MADKSTVKVTFLGDASALAKAAKRAQASTEAVGRSAAKTGDGIGRLGKAVIGAAASFGAVSMFKGFISEAEESRKIGRLTEQVIKSTGGAAQVTAKQVGDLAEAISNKTGVDDEAIQSGANLLLTFTNVQNKVGKGNDIFNRATQTITDMSVALGQDTKSSAIQLGKALNDPIKGVSALSRVGVSFTEQQKEQIKTLVKSGDALGAQKIILAELGKEFGGAAEAAASPSQKLGVILGNLKEEIGGALLPVVDRFAVFLSATLIPAARKLTATLKAQLGPAIQAVASAVMIFVNAFSGRSEIDEFDGSLRTVNNAGIKVREIFDKTIATLKGLYAWYQRNKTLVESVAVAILAVVAAVKVYRTVVAVATAAQVAWNVAMALNPIGLVVLALIGLVAGLVYAWKRSETFREVVTGAFNRVKDVAMGAFGWVKKNWPLLLGIITGPVGLAVVAVVKNFDRIKEGFRSAINWIIERWNGLEFKIPGFDPPGPGPKFGGFTLGVPNIPQLAQGGIVKARPGGTLVNVGEGGRDEAVIPLGRGGGGDSRPIVVQLVLDGKVIQESLLRRKRTTGGALGLA